MNFPLLWLQTPMLPAREDLGSFRPRCYTARYAFTTFRLRVEYLSPGTPRLRH